MTDNIQKLYEIAGVKQLEHPYYLLTYMIDGKPYPPFTAEKQLDLIKFVSNFKVYESVIHKDRKWFMCASIGCNDYCESRNESFEQALASLILELWKDLTDDQKQEIKRILQ